MLCDDLFPQAAQAKKEEKKRLEKERLMELEPDKARKIEVTPSMYIKFNWFHRVPSVVVIG